MKISIQKMQNLVKCTKRNIQKIQKNIKMYQKRIVSMVDFWLYFFISPDSNLDSKLMSMTAPTGVL